MGYILYRPCWDLSRREVESLGMNLLAYRDYRGQLTFDINFFREYIHSALRDNTESSTFAAVSTMSEYLWFRAGCPTLFVCNQDIPDLVETTTLNLSLPLLAPPGKCLCICPRTGLSMHGLGLDSVLVSRFSLRKEMSTLFGSAVDVDCSDVIITAVQLRCLGGHTTCVLNDTMDIGAYTNPKTAKGTKVWHLTNDEGRVLRTHTKLAFGLMALNRVMPLLQPGFPVDLKARDKRAFHNAGLRSSFCITETLSQRASIRAHWRHGHLRELRDTRYHKNVDGTNRVVWVRDTIVGLDTPTPYHIQGE